MKNASDNSISKKNIYTFLNYKIWRSIKIHIESEYLEEWHLPLFLLKNIYKFLLKIKVTFDA